MEHVIAILLEDPAPDMLAIVPDPRKTRAVGSLLARHGLLVGLDETVLSIAEGLPVGLMETLRSTSKRSLGALAVLDILVRATLTAGPGVLTRYMRLSKARERMAIKIPDGVFDLNELDVRPSYRNRGIGGQMLSRAESDARERGFDAIWLTTEISNPARRLYERNGFRVERTATDAVYEEMTGAPGRVLMRKTLE
jgi:ribosomal protein S18 acetylase RimI-like enzyme